MALPARFGAESKCVFFDRECRNFLHAQRFDL